MPPALATDAGAWAPNVDDRTGAGEGTLYVWGDNGSEYACAQAADPSSNLSPEGRRRLQLYCAARAHCMPDAIAAHVAGIVLDVPPAGEMYPGERLISWVVEVANRVDFAFVNSQLGILSGQNVGAALKRDWSNAVQSGDLADAIKKGDWDASWQILRSKFATSAAAAGTTIPEYPPCGPRHVNLGGLRGALGSLGAPSSAGTARAGVALGSLQIGQVEQFGGAPGAPAAPAGAPVDNPGILLLAGAAALAWLLLRKR